MNIGYFSPSYKRGSIKSITQENYPCVKLVVSKKESKQYIGSGNEIIVCPDKVQGNLCRVRNYILDQYQHDYDAIVILDDDIHYFYEFLNIERKKIKSDDEFQELCEHMVILCNEWGYNYFGMNPISDKGAYREHTPYSTIGYIGGPFQGFLKSNTLRYDEVIFLKEDYDMTLQQINKYGGCLRFNYLGYIAKQAINVGGCGTYRTTDEEKKQNKMLIKKWGSDIVRYDGQSKRGYDFNPIIKVPIKGV